MENAHPLIIVFYLDRELMNNQEIMHIITNQVNDALLSKDANALAFFLPTDESERVECINPIMVEDADMDRINKIITDITTSFDVAQGADEGIDDEDNIIELDNE